MGRWSLTMRRMWQTAGVALLLMDYYGRLTGGQVLCSATLKALPIHTTDDLGTSGPDYKFGWGLLNAQAAVEVIREHIGVAPADRSAGVLKTAQGCSRFRSDKSRMFRKASTVGVCFQRRLNSLF